MLLHGNVDIARAPNDRAIGARVARAIAWRRLAAVGLVTLLLSLGALLNPALLDFFSPAEIALAWAEHLAELGVIAAALLAAFTVLDKALPRSMPLRLVVITVLLLALSVALAVLLHAYYADGFVHLPPPLRVVADSLRWGLPAVFLVLAMGEVHARDVESGADHVGQYFDGIRGRA